MSRKMFFARGRGQHMTTALSAFVFVLFAVHSSRAQVITNIFNFNGTNGANPFYAPLVQGRDGKLYGTTSNGGLNHNGTVFRINPTNNFHSVLQNFNGTDGSLPGAGLTLASDGNFYGATIGGGSGQVGVLYRINASGTFAVIHEFQGGADGSYPYGPPVEASDGNLYGVTSGGNVDAPALYKYTRAGQYSVVYTFDRATTGWLAYGLLQGSDNLLYVTANVGGPSSCGAISKITLTGIVKATHGFSCKPGGSSPVAPVIQASDGNYYGSTQGGGASNLGVLYRIKASNFGENVLYDFASSSNAAFEPTAGLVQASDGNLYGVTFAGQGGSHLYRWNLTNGYTDLATFAGTADLTAALTQYTNGVFYGPSWIFGSNNDGYIYSLDLGLGPFVTFVRAQGKVGSSAQILGAGLAGTTSVTFNGVPASFTVVSDTYLTATIPAGATSGPVVVNTSAGTLTGNKNFKVTQ
jgi:uncharacterized repeat protein (TIGR03803 family)